jgi:hypothetical protein
MIRLGLKWHTFRYCTVCLFTDSMKSLRERKRQKKPTFPVLATLQHILFSKVDSKKMRKNPFGQYYALRSNKLTQSHNIFLICTKNRQKMRIIYVVSVQILAYKIIRILGAVFSSFLCLQNVAKVNFFQPLSHKSMT